MVTTVADQMIETLAAAGVKRVYGIGGDSLNGFTDALRRRGHRLDACPSRGGRRLRRRRRGASHRRARGPRQQLRPFDRRAGGVSGRLLCLPRVYSANIPSLSCRRMPPSVLPELSQSTTT